MNSTTNQTVNETNSTINETVNITNNCDVSLEIFTNKTIYNDEPIKFRHVLSNESYNFTIEYWIEDLFGSIIKSKRNTTNLNEKSYTPNIDESDKTLLIKSNLSVNCSDTYLSNNYAEKLVVVKGEKKESSNNQKTAEEQAKTTQTSSTAAAINKFNYEIVSYPSEIASGEEFGIKVKVYGDSKEHFLVIRSYVYKGSKHYSDEASNELVLQADKDEVVELKNIAEAAPGSYKLKVKIKKDELATEYDITKEINITEDSAKEDKTDFKNETGEKIINKIEMNYTINLTEPKILYSSKSSKANNLIKYLITGALTVISLVLIWKR